MGKFEDYPVADLLNGSEVILLARNGVTYQATVNDITGGAPSAAGIYPDVPINYVEIKRFAGQTSTTVVVSGNLNMLDKVINTAFPCTIDRNARIVSLLNGQDVTKTADGLNAVLDDWSQPAMVRVGGIWMRYFYNAQTNEKVFRFSTRKVYGYKYKRRRFLNMYGGCVEEHDGKKMLLSNTDKWTTQNVSLQNFHAYAKNLGENFREIATQDREMYRFYFWLMELTFNSQSVYNGVTCSDAWWQKLNRSEEGGAASRGQFYKTGFTNTIKGHKGEVELEVNNGESAITVKPYKWLWREGMLAGPYFIWETGYLKVGGIWYKANNINTNVSWDVTDGNWTELCPECVTAGYILEDYEDTLIPSMVGASATTGHADYYWRADNMTAKYCPAGVGSASRGSYVGGSVLHSLYDVSSTLTNYGGALASDDPTDPTPDGTLAI